MSARNGYHGGSNGGGGLTLAPAVAVKLPSATNGVAQWGTAALIEGLLFVASGPVMLTDLAKALEVERPAIEQALSELALALRSRGIRLQRSGNLVQLVTAPEAAGAVQRFLGLEASSRLSKAALETLAIIAYRQPVTRPEIEELRGVNSDGVLRTLIARGLAGEVGRRETVGLPIEYGTTFQFLEYFGLSNLADLPPVDEFAAVAAKALTHSTENGAVADGPADRDDVGEAADALASADGGETADGSPTNPRHA